MEQMNFKEWVEKFKPSVGACGWDDIIEATEEQLKNTDVKYIWTRIYGDFSEHYIISGVHRFNRDGYFITEVPYENPCMAIIHQPDEYDMQLALDDCETEEERQGVIKEFEMWYNIKIT